MEEVILSNWAKMRAKERLNIGKIVLKRKAKACLEKGLDPLKDPNMAYRLIKKTEKYKDRNTKVYLYENGFYVFRKNYLITVYPIDWLFND